MRDEHAEDGDLIAAKWASIRDEEVRRALTILDDALEVDDAFVG